jgi:hypothetical protein
MEPKFPHYRVYNLVAKQTNILTPSLVMEGNHHQGAATSTWLKLQAWFNVNTDISVMAAYYAAIILTSVSTLNQACVFS